MPSKYVLHALIGLEQDRSAVPHQFIVKKRTRAGSPEVLAIANLLEDRTPESNIVAQDPSRRTSRTSNDESPRDGCRYGGHVRKSASFLLPKQIYSGDRSRT